MLRSSELKIFKKPKIFSVKSYFSDFSVSNYNLCIFKEHFSFDNISLFLDYVYFYIQIIFMNLNYSIY